MKKITALFVGVLYFVAIIIVAFLGVQAEISNQTVEVTAIVLKEAENAAKGEQMFYPSGTDKKTCVYQLDKRPSEEDIGEDGKYNKLIWNESDGKKLDYIYTIWNFNTVADSASWRDGPMHFNLGAKVEPDNATKRELLYSIYDSTGGQEKASIDATGVIEFKQKYTAPVTYLYVSIRPTDNSSISSLVELRITAYKNS